MASIGSYVEDSKLRFRRIYDTKKVTMNEYTRRALDRRVGCIDNMGIKCLCCQSIMCTRNWIPCRRIMEILDEVTNNKKLVREMIYTYYLEKICAQNNIQCVELFDNIVKYF